GAVNRWGDEDEDSDSSVAEWDEMSSSDDEEKKAAKAAAAAAAEAAKPKKKTIAERIAEKQAEREAKRAELMKALEDDSDEEDGMSRKQRERELQIESDLRVSEDLFAGLTIKDTEVKETLLTLDPKTQEEFDEFLKALVDRIQKVQSRRLYLAFLEKLIRELALPLKDADVRKIASSLTALASEKQKAAKDALKTGKKKNKKATLGGTAKSGVDTTDYSRGYEDFDDFM
ncbi:Translation initiation factor 3 subunit J component, partial [Coemansia nantahalensis]